MSSKNKRLLSKRIALYLATGLLSCNLAYANPSGGSVVQGGATIGNGANNVLNITGVQNGTVINWNSFSIAAGETTAFTGNGAYAVLNRVTGSDLSEIYGTLTANNSGRIFLANQNGIVIGSGAVINTGAFIASTLNVTDTAFSTYADGGTLVFDKKKNLATVNSGKSGAVKIQTTTVAGTALSGAINVTGDITLIGDTVSVAPGVTFTVTSGDLLLLAAESVTYDPQNNNDGLSYTASAANTVTIGDGTSAKGLNLTADNITLAGGAVTIAGPATATYSGSTDTTKSARINASGELDIYALNTKQESAATTDNVTTYTSVYSAGSDNTVAISGNVKINDKDSSGNAVSGNKVTIVGGKVSLTGIDSDHKVVINNIDRGVSIRAINAATLTSNDTTSAGTTNLSASAANSVSLSNAKIIAGRETQTGKTREIDLQGGKISIANTRLEADGDQWDGVSMNAFTSFDKTATADGGSTTTLTMAADQSNTVSIADSTIITPEITVTGSTVGVSNSFMDASDFVRMLAADKLVRTKTVQTGGNLRTEAVTATAANTLSLTDSSIKMNSFTGLWSDDNSSYNDSYNTTVFSDARKDIQLVGGKVSLTGYKTATNTDGTTHTLGTIYDVNKNTDILVAAGKDVQYTYTGHNLDVTSLTGYSGTAANTVTFDISAAPAATYDSDAIITGQDVLIIGGTVNITGKAADAQPMIKATETTTGTGNVDIFAVNTLSNTTDAGAQATADNKVSLKDTAIATTTINDAGSDIVITGGSITMDASSLTSPSGLELYAISKITAHNDDTNAYVPLTTELDKGTINATTGSGNAITITNSKLTGDVALIGNTITATGSTLQKNDAEDNVSLYAAGSITGTFDNDNETLSITATKDNAVILGSASAPVTITAGKDVNISGGAVSITGGDGNKSTITASSDINVYAVNPLSKSDSNFTTTVAATPDNVLTVSYADMTVKSSGDSDNGIMLLGGKVDIDHAALDTAGTTIPGQQNPTAVNICAVTSANSNWTETSELATGTTSLATATGNSTSVANSTIASPGVSINGNTVKLDNVQVTASDDIGLYAINTMNGTEVETTQITDAADIESSQIAATAANTLDIANSTLKIDSAKATPYENIQTDIHLIGGAVSLTNTVQTTNNTTDVLIAAGNTVEYEHRLHELTDANIKNYVATKDNTVTLSGSTLAPTDVTVVGGAVTVDAQSAINAATDATVFALNSLTQTLDAATHKSTSFTATGTYDNSIANAGAISGANGVFLTSGGTITNSGNIVGTSEAELVAWGEVKEQGTVTAPSYLVLSGDTVAANSSDVTASRDNGVLTVNTGSTTYTVTSGYQPTVTAIGSGSTVGISGQTKKPSATSTIPTGQADEQPVVQVNQTVTNTILPVSTASPSLAPQTIAGTGVTSGAAAGGPTFPTDTPAGNTTEVAPGITMPVDGTSGQDQTGNPGTASDAPMDTQ